MKLKKMCMEEAECSSFSLPLEETLVQTLIHKKLTISHAESCTGGLLSGTIVNVSGASEVLNESYVTYSNEAKHRLLGVSNDTLEQYGAVSFETASEMAYGVHKVSGADVGVGITGIAGPTGGTSEKPVGLVYIGVYYMQQLFVMECHFSGDRLTVRKSAVKQAIAMVLKILS